MLFVLSLVNASLVGECMAATPLPQMIGQLPIECVTPGPVFEKFGIDYAGPVLVKYGHVRKPTVVSYVCVAICISHCQAFIFSWSVISLQLPLLLV